MAQQTAVKWILIELQNKFPKDMYNMYNGNQLLLESLFLQAKAIEKEQRGYSKEDVLKAGEIGEINHHDYKHIVSLLDEAREINNK
jgi:hypothetical protein